MIISAHKYTLLPNIKEIRIEDIKGIINPTDITVRSACIMKDFDKIEYFVKIPGFGSSLILLYECIFPVILLTTYCLRNYPIHFI